MVREGATGCLVTHKGVEVPVEAWREWAPTPGGVQPPGEGLLLKVVGEVSQAGGGHGDAGHLRRRAVVPAADGQAYRWSVQRPA